MKAPNVFLAFTLLLLKMLQGKGAFLCRNCAEEGNSVITLVRELEDASKGSDGVSYLVSTMYACST